VGSQPGVRVPSWVREKSERGLQFKLFNDNVNVLKFLRLLQLISAPLGVCKFNAFSLQKSGKSWKPLFLLIMIKQAKINEMNMT